MQLIITGATGMVGSEVLRQALLNNDITRVISVGRRIPDIIHSKLEHILHTDFMDYTALQDRFRSADACVWCLGVPQAWVTKEEYEHITFDYTLAAARALLAVNPAVSFLFLSGAGADSKEKSRITFARVKGKTENALLQLPFKKLIIPRPGGIEPVVKPAKAPFSYKLVYPLYPLLKIIMPGQVITSVELARVILYLITHESGKVILENKDLKKIVKIL